MFLYWQGSWAHQYLVRLRLVFGEVATAYTCAHTLLLEHIRVALCFLRAVCTVLWLAGYCSTSFQALRASAVHLALCSCWQDILSTSPIHSAVAVLVLSSYGIYSRYTSRSLCASYVLYKHCIVWMRSSVYQSFTCSCGCFAGWPRLLPMLLL